MIDYTHYHRAMVAVTKRGYAFVYWVNRYLCPLDETNYGRGKSHWLEYLGKMSKESCRMTYYETPVLDATDTRINEFCRQRIADMETLVAS